MRNRLNEQVNRMKSMMLIEDITNDGGNLNFEAITKIIIDKLEGGYYHPDMLRDGRVKSSLYNSSGETMFGIDRLNGKDISREASGVEFWNIIDNANARKNWTWNYKGGNLQSKLTSLVAKMMQPFYIKFSNRYLTDKSKEIINKNDGLLFNFVYATWNGEGWFKYFAKKFNADVESGITDNKQLLQNVIKYRLESRNQIIVNTGKNINQRVFGNLDTNFKLNGTTNNTDGVNAYDLNNVDMPQAYDMTQKL